MRSSARAPRSILTGLLGLVLLTLACGDEQSLGEQPAGGASGASGASGSPGVSFEGQGAPCEVGVPVACYSGPPATRGVGLCRTGTFTCERRKDTWQGDGPTSSYVTTTCIGDVLPEVESCNGVDDDCDGTIDEGCACQAGETRPCGAVGLPAPCQAGAQSCGADGTWSACQGATLPVAEACGDGVDNDCDGQADEGCAGGAGGGSGGAGASQGGAGQGGGGQGGQGGAGQGGGGAGGEGPAGAGQGGAGAGGTPGEVGCVAPSGGPVQFDAGGHYLNVIAGSSPEQVLVIAPTAKGYPPLSGLDSYDTWVMGPDGSNAKVGKFFARAPSVMIMHNVVWAAPYFYVVWHEQSPGSDVWLGRLDTSGNAVGDPLQIGSSAVNSVSGAVGTDGSNVVVASMQSSYSVQVRVVDTASFSLGQPVVIPGDSEEHLYPSSVAVQGKTVAVAGYGSHLVNGNLAAKVAFVREDGSLYQHLIPRSENAYLPASVAANGGVFLMCSADKEGSFGPGRDAFRQWCQTIDPAGDLGGKTEVGYKSNFMVVEPRPFAGGFVINSQGYAKEQAVAFGQLQQQLVLLDDTGALKQKIDVVLPSQQDNQGPMPVVTAGACVQSVLPDVVTYNQPDADVSSIKAFCPAACP